MSPLTTMDIIRNGHGGGKIKYLLNLNGPQTTTQLVEAIQGREPNAKRKLVVGGVSANLSTAFSNGRLYDREKNEKQDYVYKLKEEAAA